MTVERRGRRRRWFWLALASVAILVVLAVVSSIPGDEREAPSPELAGPEPRRVPTVFTYFYYWYDLPGGVHSTALTHRPANPSASYRNLQWLKSELTDMEAAGVDVALAVYWGDAEPSSDVGLQNMVQAAQELRAAGRDTPDIGLFLDTGLIGRWDYDDRDLRKPENIERFYSLIARFYEIVPEELRGNVDGRPVVWLWGSWFDIRFGQPLFDYVYRQGERDFGSRPYIVADNSWRFSIGTGFLGRITVDRSRPVAIDDFYSWGASIEGYREEGGNVAQIGPGYDERELGGSPDRVGRHTPRDGGAFYRRSWEAAIDSDKPYVAIETWNEFHEASGIANSTEYGRRYIEMTRDYVRKFKASH